MPTNRNAVLWESEPKRIGTPAEFKQVYGPAADRVSKSLGVPANVILGQWGLETGWGKSVIPGTNNLGNIKDFAGGGVAATDNMTGSRDKYRAYDTPEAFADDYVNLVKRKFPGAVGAKSASAFASALKDGGYAEDPGYVTKVAQASGMVDRQPGPVMARLGKMVDGVIPSAQAATTRPQIDAQQVQWEDAPTAPPKRAAIDPKAVLWESETEAAPAPTRKREEANLGFGGKVLRGLGGALGPGQIIADLATDGTFSRDMAAGLVRGAGSIGSTLMRPFESAEENAQRRASIDAGLADMGANTKSVGYGGGKLAGEIAGTAGAGTVLAAPLRAAAPVVSGVAPAIGNYVTRVGNALASGGMSLGGQGGNLLANTALRVGTGAAATGAGAGLIDPKSAGTGAVIGGLLPPVVGTMARAGGAFVNGVRGLVDMATAPGQNRIAEAVMRASATNPAQAAARLAQARPVVPGSLPTTGQVPEHAIPQDREKRP